MTDLVRRLVTWTSLLLMGQATPPGLMPSQPGVPPVDQATLFTPPAMTIMFTSVKYAIDWSAEGVSGRTVPTISKVAESGIWLRQERSRASASSSFQSWKTLLMM